MQLPLLSGSLQIGSDGGCTALPCPPNDKVASYRSIQSLPYSTIPEWLVD